ncbi:MAG: restriction endonuclease subunit S [Methanoregula sp.]|jgi:type I restriction enzyme S subunit
MIDTPYGSFPDDYNLNSLEDLCVKKIGIQTGPFGSQLHNSDYVSVGTPILTVEHLGENRILHENLPRVTEEDRQRLIRYSIKKGDIIFSRVGSVDRRALVRDDEEDWLFSGRCLRVRPNPEKLDSIFLSYLMGLPTFQEYVRKIAVGATMPSINTKILSSIPICYPPLPTQHAIARILGSLDDKIELNRQMNETLEAMARAISQSWFVDFDPVRAKAEGRQPAGMDAETAALFPDGFEEVDGRDVPRGWGVATLGDFIEVVKGLSYKGEGLCDDGIPMHNLNSVLEGGGYKYRGIKFYNGEYQERHIIHHGDVIVTNTEQGFDFLLIGYPAIIPKFYGETGLFSHHTFRVRPLIDSPLTNHFIYYLLMSPAVREQVIGCTNGTTVNMMYMDGLITPQFVLPSPQLIKEFEKIVSPMFDLMENYEQQSRTLAEIRDALLPKLMSGEVQVRSKDEDKNLT